MQKRIHVTVQLSLDTNYCGSQESLVAGLPDILQSRLWGLIADEPEACQIARIDSGCSTVLIDVQGLEVDLAKRKQIAVLWNIDDVLTLRPDLSDSQAWQVLLAAKAAHDRRFGINSDVLEVTAETLYGPPPEAIAVQA